MALVVVASNAILILVLASLKRHLRQRPVLRRRLFISCAVFFILVKLSYYLLWVPYGLYVNGHLDPDMVALSVYHTWLGYFCVFYILDLVRIGGLIVLATVLHVALRRRALRERLLIEAAAD
jgi:hypothetical protein